MFNMCVGYMNTPEHPGAAFKTVKAGEPTRVEVLAHSYHSSNASRVAEHFVCVLGNMLEETLKRSGRRSEEERHPDPRERCLNLH